MFRRHSKHSPDMDCEVANANLCYAIYTHTHTFFSAFRTHIFTVSSCAHQRKAIKR
jgi:hypothetical protein